MRTVPGRHWMHRGVRIELEDDDFGHFVFTPDEDTGVCRAASLTDARAAIDARGADRDAEIKVKIDLTAIHCDGSKLRITGVHRRTGKLLLDPKVELESYQFIYHPAAEGLVLEAAALRKRLMEVDDKLRGFRLPTRLGNSYGSHVIQPGDYARLVEGFADTYARAGRVR